MVEPGGEFAVAGFRITPFRVNHSIPDGVGYAITTRLGTIVHTGDFKFDHTPPDGKRADLGLIAEIGNRGVAFLLSDSTRAEKEGYTLSETTVGESLHRLVGEAPGRVIVATFASNIGRVQQVIDAAWAHGRKMVAHRAEHGAEHGHRPRARLSSTPARERWSGRTSSSACRRSSWWS